MCVMYYSYGSLETSVSSEPPTRMTHNIQQKKKNHLFHSNWHPFLLLRQWLTGFTIQLLCFCAFHASRSQGNHRAATEGTPYYQAAESAGKCYTPTLKKHTGEAGELVQEQTQTRRRLPSGRDASGLSSVRCGLQQNTRIDPHLKSCRVCSGK